MFGSNKNLHFLLWTLKLLEFLLGSLEIFTFIVGCPC